MALACTSSPKEEEALEAFYPNINILHALRHLQGDDLDPSDLQTTTMSAKQRARVDDGKKLCQMQGSALPSAMTVYTGPLGSPLGPTKFPILCIVKLHIAQYLRKIENSRMIVVTHIFEGVDVRFLGESRKRIPTYNPSLDFFSFDFSDSIGKDEVIDYFALLELSNDRGILHLNPSYVYHWPDNLNLRYYRCDGHLGLVANSHDAANNIRNWVFDAT